MRRKEGVIKHKGMGDVAHGDSGRRGDDKCNI